MGFLHLGDGVIKRLLFYCLGKGIKRICYLYLCVISWLGGNVTIRVFTYLLHVREEAPQAAVAQNTTFHLHIAHTTIGTGKLGIPSALP